MISIEQDRQSADFMIVLDVLGLISMFHTVTLNCI